MAGEAIVGALRVVLGMDTASFEDGAKKTETRLHAFGANIGKAAAGIGIAFTAAATAMGVALKGAIDQAEKLGESAQKFGIPVEKLSLLSEAASLSNVSLEALGKSFVRLSKNMTEAAGGASNVAASAFKYLGIQVTTASGALKASEEVMLEIADQFANMEDGASKTALAVAIFGRAGAEMIPFLNQGRKGIESLTETLRKMGFEITAETAIAANQFNDNLELMGKISRGVGLQLAEQLLPALQDLSRAMLEFATDGERLASTVGALARGIELLVFTFRAAVNGAMQLGAIFRTLTLTAVELAKGNFTQAMKEWDEGINQVKNRAIEFGEVMDKTFGEDRQGQIDNVVRAWESVDKAVSAFISSNREPFKGVNKDAERFDETIRKLKLQAAETAGTFSGTLAPGFISAAQSLNLIKEDGSNLAQILTLSTEQAKQLNEALLGVEGAKMTQEFLTPWQQYEEQLKRINLLLSNQKISAETAAAAQQKSALDVARSYGETAQAIVAPMADAFKTLAQMNKKYAGVAKAAAIAEALVNTFLAATNALARVPPPFNIAAAAAVTAAGLANVAKISATEFAQGGSFKVGGVGGIDSQLISFKATPGEMVDVRTPGQQRGAEGSPVNVTLNGESFSRNQVRDLFDTINSGIRDGYRIKLA